MRKNISSYIKSRAGWFILSFLFPGIFWCVLYLYNVRADALNYAVVLSLFLLVCWGAADFTLYCGQIKAVSEALAAYPWELRNFPEDRTGAEELYRVKLEDMFDLHQEQETQNRLKRQEMLDYYSLWVHQIKTPIAAMHLLLQSAEESGVELAESKFIPHVRMELFKTEQYVEMVLSYLRMEDMSSDLSLKWYPLDDIVRQAVRKYSQLFILKKIRLDYQECGFMVLTDEKWLLFVLGQLLSNALKYTPKGSISIYMEPGSQGALIIKDTGIGIWEEDLPRIFEKGFTGYNGRKDKKSTGIGLYLCRSVCTELGHGLEVSSKVGEGTSVRVNLFREENILE